MTRSQRCAAVVLFLMHPPAGAASQAVMRASPDGGVFEGQIVDSISGDPIPDVLVRMDNGAEAVSDERGAFRFTNLPRGRRLYAVLSSDCRVTWGRIDVIEGIPRRETLRLPPMFGAASADAEREVEERRRGGGKRVEADEIARMQVHSVTDLIRRVAPNMVSSMGGDPGATSAFRSGRARSFMPTDPPVVVIDGVRVPNAEGVLHELLASEVQVLEVQPGAVAGWQFGSSGAAGVIRVTLKRGIPTGAPEQSTTAPCLVHGFPRR